MIQLIPSGSYHTAIYLINNVIDLVHEIIDICKLYQRI